MKQRSIVLAVFATVSAAAGASPAQEPASPPRFESGAEAVALDIVVRDRKDRLVTDLRPDEVQVLEDGVPQDLATFRLANPPAAAAAASAGGAPRPSSPTTAEKAAEAPSRRFVLAFGKLTADGRRLAQEAGEEFARKHVAPPVEVTIVRVDPALVAVLDRSGDPAAVREGVQRATSLAAAGKERASGPVGEDTGYAAAQLPRFQGGAGVGDLAQADNVATLHALVKVVEGLEREPGRKTVLFFTEGFAVAPGYEHVFSDLVSRANRANVTFYGMDVRGLQLSTRLGSSGDALSQAAAISAQQRLSGSGDSAPVTREQMTQDDTMQSSFRSDVVAALSQLSGGTGGFVATETNDFRRPLLRIVEDSKGYYESSYTPKAPPVPGQFRRIEVRVLRKDVRVQARSGYYVAPASLVAAFAGQDLPDEFDVRSAFYRFGREKEGAFECLLKLEASLDKAEFRTDPQTARLSGRVVLAGRVLDMRGEVVDTFGQDVGLGGTAEQVGQVRDQMLPLARRLRLRPGAYTIEVLVRDAVGNHASGRRLEATVPSPDGALAISSLVLVSRVEPVAPQSDPTDPLRIGDQRIVPNVARRLAVGAATLPVYYVAYVPPGAKDAVTATVQVSRDGRAVARGQAPLPPPDAEGRIVGLSPIPTQKLEPGTYEVQVTVAAGGHEARETTTVTIGS